MEAFMSQSNDVIDLEQYQKQYSLENSFLKHSIEALLKETCHFSADQIKKPKIDALDRTKLKNGFDDIKQEEGLFEEMLDLCNSNDQQTHQFEPEKARRQRNYWTKDEDAMLLQLVNKHGHKWKLISAAFVNRNRSRVYERYKYLVGQQSKRDQWHKSEDFLLFVAFKIMGNNWQDMSALFEGRSTSAIKCRHFRIKNDIKLSEFFEKVLKFLRKKHSLTISCMANLCIFNSETNKYLGKQKRGLIPKIDFKGVIQLVRANPNFAYHF